MSARTSLTEHCSYVLFLRILIFCWILPHLPPAPLRLLVPDIPNRPALVSIRPPSILCPRRRFVSKLSALPRFLFSIMLLVRPFRRARPRPHLAFTLGRSLQVFVSSSSARLSIPSNDPLFADLLREADCPNPMRRVRNCRFRLREVPFARFQERNGSNCTPMTQGETSKEEADAKK